MTEPSIPRLFLFAARKRSLLVLAALTLVSGAAMLWPMGTMGAHGAGLLAFESAANVSRSQEILDGWGNAGETAMWWQLVLDTPFLVGYGLFLAGACAAVGLRARERGRLRLAQTAAAIAWLGPLAAAADLLQNVSLALVLGGHVVQPWPRISALAGLFTTSACAVAAVFAVCGMLATRRRKPAINPERP